MKVTLTDADHQLMIEADYEYELDGWGRTRRTVWVRTPESGEWQLLEKVTRTLTYYAGVAGE